MSRDHAQTIWNAAVAAVRPGLLLASAVVTLEDEIAAARRIVVMGAGKAGAAMSVALEAALGPHLDKLVGWVNVPAGTLQATRRIHLHPARRLGSNHPTDEGVVGSQEILKFAREAEPRDLGLCLISGGGSALLPAPADGITLADKQAVTKLLHACGATINEMNAVRKHLSAIKGGRLAQAFAGRPLISLILSDVIGDPLDVIASGPTAADPTTFADVADILTKYHLNDKVPDAIRHHLKQGQRGTIPETPKTLPDSVRNVILGNNAKALAAAQRTAEDLGYHVINLGSDLEGETQVLAKSIAGRTRNLRDQHPSPPVCLLSGGETTVTLTPDSGKGGRNQEFVLACALDLGAEGLRNVVILSGGTDGEDGPTDAAGAFADANFFAHAARANLDPADHLRRHDAYPFFQATDDLLISGPTETNVMDVRVILIGPASI